MYRGVYMYIYRYRYMYISAQLQTTLTCIDARSIYFLNARHLCYTMVLTITFLFANTCIHGFNIKHHTTSSSMLPIL